MQELSTIEKAYMRTETQTKKPCFTFTDTWGGSWKTTETVEMADTPVKHYAEGIAPPPERLAKMPEYYINDPSATYDNYAALRMFLKLRGLSDLRIRHISEPYRNGYYKISDGKSHPIPWLRIPYFLKVIGFKKDPASVRHDLDYYQGATTRKAADQTYYTNQVLLGLPQWKAWGEYLMLRAFGWRAWSEHRRRANEFNGYGTLTFIRMVNRTQSDLMGVHNIDDYIEWRRTMDKQG